MKIMKIFQNSIGEEYTILPTSDNFLSKRPALEKVDGLKKV